MQMGCQFKPFEKMMLTIEVVIDPPDFYRFFRHFYNISDILGENIHSQLSQIFHQYKGF